MKERNKGIANCDESFKMLKIMEKVGNSLLPNERHNEIKELPVEIQENDEYLIRFYLLQSILDQQARIPSALNAAKYIFTTFKEKLFDNPLYVIKNFSKLIPVDKQRIYDISPAIGRVIPRFGWVVLRVGGFLMYEYQIKEHNIQLSEKFKELNSPLEAIDYLNDSAIIRSILREKAMNMYISNIGHPKLGINVSKGKWKKEDFPMLVDGHVGRVFCRTGILEDVYFEARTGSRAWIIQASQMRKPINNLVLSNKEIDGCMVDYGAFGIGYNCCPDDGSKACCIKCKKLTCEIREVTKSDKCVLSEFCKKNMKWRAY